MVSVLAVGPIAGRHRPHPFHTFGGQELRGYAYGGVAAGFSDATAVLRFFLFCCLSTGDRGHFPLLKSLRFFFLVGRLVMLLAAFFPATGDDLQKKTTNVNICLCLAPGSSNYIGKCSLIKYSLIPISGNPK